MSQDLDHHHHHSIFSYQEQQDHDHHIAQQIRREKLRLHGFHQPAPPLVAGTPDRDQSPVVYKEPTGMLAEMFNFPPPAPTAGAGPTAGQFQAAANSMQLFLMNPSAAAQTRSPPSADPNSAASMLLPNPNPNNHGGYEIQGFATAPAPAFVEGQGLSLSLSSNVLHHLYTNNQLAPPPATTAGEASNAVHMAYGSSIGMVNVLRNSKYLNAARELLEEFCSVWRSGRFENKEAKEVAGQTYGRSNPNNNGASSCSNNNSSSISKDSAPSLSSANRMEHQRRKVKLLAMLDEVEGRYKHYCEQMQMVVNSFDLVMGMGAAAPYTALAQKAMSRHFRCLKDAIEAQLKHSCELLGESGGRSCGITKGETPRLKMLDHTLRQQRSFHQMDHDAWRPQRGLPDRSVTVLRAWLFEHFLHPYPSDADKHLLARQTGLSRIQVSNWFINARVRLWKPMVEEMYQQEAKEDDSNDDVFNSNNNTQQEEERESSRNPSNSGSSSSTSPHMQQHEAQTPTPRRCPNYNINNNAVSESDASVIFSGNGHPPPCSGVNRQLQIVEEDMYAAGGNNIEFGAVGEFVRVDRRPPTSGDVSLTLGLRHAGAHNSNATSFSFTDFGAS